jgi:glycosidase
MTRVAVASPLVLAAIVLSGALALSSDAAAPTITKVEPPTWWAGHSVNPVRLLIRGSDLAGASVETTRPDVRPGRVRVNPRGTYAFVDLTISPRARTGVVPLRLVTQAGSAAVPFEIVAPLSRQGRFQGFNEDDAIYLLMPDRFANGDPANDRPARSPTLFDRTRSRFYHGGDLQGVIDHLPYLRDLGITTVWLNPVYDNADYTDPVRRYDNEPFTDYHGYGAVDFYAVDEHLGDLSTLRRLVDAAHAAGLKIMLDQVANHTGPFHPWLDDPPTPTWFNGTRDSHLANSFDAPLLNDPRTSEMLRRRVLDGWFADLLPDLNQTDPETAHYLIQNSLWWIGVTGLDAIRQDTVPYVPRTFWRDWTAALLREYPALRIVGEVLDPTPPFVASFQAGRRDARGVDTGIHALFDYPLFFAVRKAMTGAGSLRDVTTVLSQDSVYPKPERLVTLIGSHDVRRFMGEPRADVEGLKLAATVLLTSRGIPQWYYGDEIALSGGDDPHNRRDFPGGWPDDPRNAFEASGRTAVERDVFDHVRALLHLRRSHESLRRGKLTHLALSDSVYVYARGVGAHSVIVALNTASETAKLDVNLDGTELREGVQLRDALDRARPTVVRGHRASIEITGRSSAVFVRR